MRILAATHSLQTNGAAFALVRMLVALRKAGASVSVLHTENHPLCESLRANGIEILENADTANFDVAIVNTLIDHARVEQIAPYLPVLFWVHEGMSLLANLDLHEQWHKAFRLSSRIVFQTPWQSEAVFRSLLNRIEAHRVRFAPIGVSQRPPDHQPASMPEMRQVISIGSIHPRKRHVDLLEAVLANGDIGMRCKLVGNHEWMDQNNPELMRSIRERPQTFTLASEPPGTPVLLDNTFVIPHMDSASLYASASADETFGMANMEAAAWGLPPALSNLACYEGIWKHGVNALMHPVGRVDCLAWNLRALALDAGLSQRIAQAATRTARRFTMERFVQTMAEVLEECITDRVMFA